VEPGSVLPARERWPEKALRFSSPAGAKASCAKRWRIECARQSRLRPGDATIATDVQRVTAAAVKFMGGLDTILVSAGAGGRTPIFDTPVEEFQRIIDHSLLPPFLAMRYGAEHLMATGKASVIVISSMYGLVGQKERAGYCAGKHGVIGLVKSAALDFADKGRACQRDVPGLCRDAAVPRGREAGSRPEAVLQAKRLMHAIPRAGRLDEMGEMAVYLASDLAAFVTGQAFAIDGGYSTR
jgi:NAD(P)-dependent dehydrogenase (short-subunit alcohol dehydrogenase family)